MELADYINWFNNFRIHSSLGYLSPNLRHRNYNFLYEKVLSYHGPRLESIIRLGSFIF
jgi:hypothetical protein